MHASPARSRSRIIIAGSLLLIVACCAAAAFFLWPRQSGPTEERIVLVAESALQERDIPALLEHVAVLLGAADAGSASVRETAFRGIVAIARQLEGGWPGMEHADPTSRINEEDAMLDVIYSKVALLASGRAGASAPHFQRLFFAIQPRAGRAGAVRRWEQWRAKFEIQPPR